MPSSGEAQCALPFMCWEHGLELCVCALHSATEQHPQTVAVPEGGDKRCAQLYLVREPWPILSLPHIEAFVGVWSLMTTDTFGSQLACCGTRLQCLVRLPASSVLAFSEPDSWGARRPHMVLGSGAPVQ